MGTWYELIALDNLPAGEIVSHCKKTDGKRWRKPFEEDLVLVLQEMEKQGHFDSETGSLTVRRSDTRERSSLRAYHGQTRTATPSWRAL